MYFIQGSKFGFSISQGLGGQEGRQTAVVGKAGWTGFCIQPQSWELSLAGIPPWLGQGTPLWDCQAPSNPENG